MALTYTEAESISTKNFDPVIKQQEYQSSAYYTKLKNKGHVVRGGLKIAWTIRYTGYDRADAVDPDAQFVYETVPTRTLAEDDWKYYKNDTMVTWEEQVKHKGKPAQVKLLADKIKEMKEDLDDRFATDLYTANLNGITPLPTIIDAADDYAGISVTDAANWASQEDSTTDTLTLYGAAGSLSTMENAATFGKLRPNFHLTTRDLFSKFESILEPQKRYEDTEMANAGFTSLKFRGNPVVPDYYCPAGSWYGLCTDVLYMVYDSEFNFKISPWKPLEQSGYPFNMVKIIAWVGNNKCTVRRCHFKMTALDYTL